MPAPQGDRCVTGTAAPLVGAVVAIVSVLVTAAEPVTFTALGPIEHVGRSLAPTILVLTEHVRLTLPVNPF